jgi:hypothetical protein
MSWQNGRSCVGTINENTCIATKSSDFKSDGERFLFELPNLPQT